MTNQAILPIFDRIPGYHWYDTPDGEDCLKKVIYMNKLGIFAGAVVGTLDAVSFNKQVGAKNIALGYARITLPIMAVGSTFATVTCLSTNFRGKDDFWNYFNGGFASGCIAGAVFRSGTFGTLCAVSFGIIAATKKYARQNDTVLFPPIPGSKDGFSYAGPFGLKWDLSLTKDDQPRGWKTSED